VRLVDPDEQVYGSAQAEALFPEIEVFRVGVC
jgi:hypothetical protein